MASSKNSNEHQKSNWDDLAIEDSASDLEDSWAGEEVMFDGSPSSGNFEIVVSFGRVFQNSFYTLHISQDLPKLIQLLFRQDAGRNSQKFHPHFRPKNLKKQINTIQYFLLHNS